MVCMEHQYVVTIGTMQVLVKAGDKHKAGVAAVKRLKLTRVIPDEVRVRKASPRDLERWTDIEARARVLSGR